MLNKTVVQGRLVADPELRATQSGVLLCSFRVAWSEKYKEAETRLFLSCTAWRGVGEMIAKYFRKGREIVVEGRLQTREWTDQAGGKRSTVELNVDKAHFCGPKEEGGTAARTAGSGVDVYADGFAEIDEDGELPF